MREKSDFFYQKNLLFNLFQVIGRKKSTKSNFCISQIVPKRPSRSLLSCLGKKYRL